MLVSFGAYAHLTSFESQNRLESSSDEATSTLPNLDQAIRQILVVCYGTLQRF
jgi:hypothetical protein